MALNWGGFAQGLNSGMVLGSALKNAIKEDQINKVREQGLAEAQAARQDALTQADGSVVESAAPQTGQVAPDRPEAYTQAVPTPPVMTAQPLNSSPASSPAASGVPSNAVAPAAPMVDAAPAAQGLPPAGNVEPPAAPKPFMVGQQGFDTRDAANKAARKSVGSEREFFLKVGVPQITQKLTEMGELDKADAWQRYAGEQQTQKNMETWAQMARSAQSGNFEKAADHAFDLYKQYDDGVTPVSKELVKDDQGNVTGFNVKLKTDATGEERSQFIGTREITEMGLSALSPPAMFEQMYKRQSAADAAGAQARVKSAHDAQTFQREVVKQGMIDNRVDKRQTAADAAKAVQAEREHGYRLEELTTAENLKQAGIGKAEQAKVQSHIDLLRNNGYSADEVKDMLPVIMKVGEFKKSTDPSERRAMIATELAKDPLFMRKSLDEKNKAVDDMMTVAGAGNSPRRASPAAKPSATSSAQAVPGPANAGKIQVWDSKTQSIIYR